MKRLIVALLILASPAFAEEPRTIDMTVVLKDAAGKPIADMTQSTPEDPQCAKCCHLTLGRAAATALLVERQKEEPNLAAVDKAKRGALALYITDNPAAKLTAAQIAEIVRLMNIWPPLIVVRSIPLLDPNIDLTK